jgi:uncharacterized protein (TIGR03435 family)
MLRAPKCIVFAALAPESKEMPAYALLVGKGGPKLQQVKPEGTTMNADGNNNSEFGNDGAVIANAFPRKTGRRIEKLSGIANNVVRGFVISI